MGNINIKIAGLLTDGTTAEIPCKLIDNTFFAEVGESQRFELIRYQGRGEGGIVKVYDNRDGRPLKYIQVDNAMVESLGRLFNLVIKTKEEITNER